MSNRRRCTHEHVRIIVAHRGERDDYARRLCVACHCYKLVGWSKDAKWWPMQGAECVAPLSEADREGIAIAFGPVVTGDAAERAADKAQAAFESRRPHLRAKEYREVHDANGACHVEYRFAGPVLSIHEGLD